MTTFFGNLLSACLAFGVVLWLQWQQVEQKIVGMADAYGAPASVQQAPVVSATPDSAAPTAAPAPATP